MTLSTRQVLRLLPALSVCMACSSPAPQAGDGQLDIAVARSDATNVVYFASPRVQPAPQFTASSPDLERRDQPVTETDLSRLKSADVSARPAVNQIAPDGLLTRIDHLVYATPDLQRGIDQIERLLGVRATPGGQHPGRGTRNALIALGPASYLEIIGPDPEQPAPAQPRPFGIDGLKEPRLVTWAAKGMNLDSLARSAARDGVKLGEVIAGSRRRADGVLLTWRYTDPRIVVADGVVPFVIDWGATPHPSSTATPGASLIDLRAEHPDPQRVLDALKRLGLELRVQRGARAGLTATVDSPRGRVELR